MMKSKDVICIMKVLMIIEGLSRNMVTGDLLLDTSGDGDELDHITQDTNTSLSSSTVPSKSSLISEVYSMHHLLNTSDASHISTGSYHSIDKLELTLSGETKFNDIITPDDRNFLPDSHSTLVNKFSDIPLSTYESENNTNIFLSSLTTASKRRFLSEVNIDHHQLNKSDPSHISTKSYHSNDKLKSTLSGETKLNDNTTPDDQTLFRDSQSTPVRADLTHGLHSNLISKTTLNYHIKENETTSANQFPVNKLNTSPDNEFSDIPLRNKISTVDRNYESEYHTNTLLLNLTTVSSSSISDIPHFGMSDNMQEKMLFEFAFYGLASLMALFMCISLIVVIILLRRHCCVNKKKSFGICFSHEGYNIGTLTQPTLNEMQFELNNRLKNLSPLVNNEFFVADTDITKSAERYDKILSTNAFPSRTFSRQESKINKEKVKKKNNLDSVIYDVPDKSFNRTSRFQNNPSYGFHNSRDPKYDRVISVIYDEADIPNFMDESYEKPAERRFSTFSRNESTTNL